MEWTDLAQEYIDTFGQHPAAPYDPPLLPPGVTADSESGEIGAADRLVATDESEQAPNE
ncbi:hypothetical protein H5V45_20795 [Nocardioides sp. KIGAM211]|uniref:Uncharacterized protein n=1 Tax=Nocardioides luti TaxID=2761101 RepID=A0A7X0RMQ0_9ACTN|nr:hypothetical protein [Nocardioides luti]MBB6629768.1 hypothetical protein [Nocardioides luti]